MVSLVVIDRSGQEHRLPADGGRTMMEVIRDSGLGEILALCGGCLSCATCHVHIDPNDADRLPAMSNDEDALLSSSEHRTAYSRLSCQLPVGENLDGMRVTIAQED